MRVLQRGIRSSAFAPALAVALSAGSAPADAARPPVLFVAGRLVHAAALTDRTGHVLVPVRGVFEALDARVQYQAPSMIVVRRGEAVVAGLLIGRRAAVVDGRRIALADAPLRHHGHVYVPLRAVAQLAGADVRYDARDRIVDVRPHPRPAPVLPAAAVAPQRDDDALPWWMDAVAGALVLTFILEFVRRLRRAQAALRRRPALRAATVRTLALARSVSSIEDGALRSAAAGFNDAGTNGKHG